MCIKKTSIKLTWAGSFHEQRAQNLCTKPNYSVALRRGQPFSIHPGRPERPCTRCFWKGDLFSSLLLFFHKSVTNFLTSPPFSCRSCVWGSGRGGEVIVRSGHIQYSTNCTSPPGLLHATSISPLVYLLPLFLQTALKSHRCRSPLFSVIRLQEGGHKEDACRTERKKYGSTYLLAQYDQTINTACVHTSWQSNVAINTNTDTPSRNVSLSSMQRHTHRNHATQLSATYVAIFIYFEILMPTSDAYLVPYNYQFQQHFLVFVNL